MYYPYFRGKQYELAAIQAVAPIMARMQYAPVIEPVRSNTRPLEAALGSIRDSGGSAILIVNPKSGQLRGQFNQLVRLLGVERANGGRVVAGILVHRDTTEEEASACELLCGELPRVCISTSAASSSLVGRILLDSHATASIRICIRREEFAVDPEVSCHCSIIMDGFRRRIRNADYPEDEYFSDLHSTYEQLGAEGFGDFLTVGDREEMTGGRPYAVAIHLTYIDAARDNCMRVRHFLSDTNDSQDNPGGKFFEALNKLLIELNSGRSMLYESTAISEFRDLHARQHFPGLGIVKKLSMIHHIETIAQYYGVAR